MNAATRDAVRRRANDCCEYCRIAQAVVPFSRHHVEHVRPRKHGGNDELDNLALACIHCNLHKGPNLSGIDPETGRIVDLFSPRDDAWSEHFRRQGAEIVGVTSTGRATVVVLNMNALSRLRLRE